MTSKIEISPRTIVFTFLFVATIWLVIEIKNILLLLYVAYILMSAIRPFVEKLTKYKIPKFVSIIVVYILIGVCIGVTVSTMIPVLVSQTNRFVTQLPGYIEYISPYYEIDVRSFSAQIAPIGENIIRFTVGIFSNIVTIMTVLIFTFYLLLEYERIIWYVKRLFGRVIGERIASVMTSVEILLGAWLRGQLLLMFFVGLLTYIFLSFLSVEYALPLAIIAGLFEIVPYIGPILSAIPALLVTLPVSPLLALATASVYFIVQQLENTVIVPLVMNKAVGLSPLIIIVSLMIGSQLAGIMGAVLAIPIVVMVRAILVTLLKDEMYVKAP